MLQLHRPDAPSGIVAERRDSTKSRAPGRTDPPPAQAAEPAPAWASPHSSYITGETIGVTGGRLLP
jgi:NAD(P)-dependent dehydrogenase (short-subunit alcohol dehydrogenase family)